MKVDKRLFWLFFISIFTPTVLSVSLGGLRLTLYRITLLIFLTMALTSILKICKPSWKNPSFLMLCYTIWAALALMVNHGPMEKLETSGVYFIEVFGPYLITFVFCQNLANIKKVVYAYLASVTLTLLITLPEAITGINWLQKLLGVNLPFIGMRGGLHRAYGTFDHPILQGVYAGTALGLAWFLAQRKFIVGTVIATITSMSSGALVALIIQAMLITWEKITKNVKKRWGILLILILVFYFAVDLFSNRSAMRAILTNMTMSPHTAYWRMLIWEYGMQNVWENPIFGIGFHDWERPSWMYSGSMDAFWLVSMVRYGLPAFIMYAGAYLVVIFGLFKIKAPTKEILLLRRGWLCGMIGLAVSSCTVHLWNNSLVFINFYLGLGAAMLVVFQREAKRYKQIERDKAKALQESKALEPQDTRL